MRMTTRAGGLLGILLSVAMPAAARAAAPAVMTVAVDATEAPRGVLRARLSIPAAPGPMTLAYPKWIPGEHAPSGPLNGVAGLTISAAGKPLPWRRDDVEMYAFHVEVPAGARSLDVTLEFLDPVGGGQFSSGVSHTAQLAMLSWNQVVLYPADARSDDLRATASLKMPAGWKLGTALPLAKQQGAAVEFKTVSLATLVDSPVLMGAHFRSFPLTPGATPAHFVDVAADSAAALEAPPELVDHWRRLVLEAGALFGARHYGAYHFLLSLSNQVSHFGLEHHESSDDRQPERTLVDAPQRLMGAGLFGHEYVHSWNGKYRRPVGLATPDYLSPMKSELVWVYEGLTTYLGNVLTARAGLRSTAESLDALAFTAAEMDHRPGRAWRSLADTAVSAPFLYGAPHAWSSWRRGVDFYPEMDLVWLEVDSIIRRESRGAKSLDDFCRTFHGAPGGPPALKPYGFDDVVAALTAVQPYDWKRFLRERLDATRAAAPLGGLAGVGWKLVYDDTPSSALRAWEEARHATDFSFSLGFTVQDDGAVLDVIPGMPAATAGLAPGMKLVAVDGRRFSKEVARDAVRATRTRAGLELLVENGEYFRTLKVAYQGGEKIPHLGRDGARPDLLNAIWKPQTPYSR